MIVRELRASDLAQLAAIDSEPDRLPHLHSSFTEGGLVVLDEQGKPIMACVAERTVQVYLVASKKEAPFTGSQALRRLSEAMARLLKEKGYTEAVAFVSDPRFGNLLEHRHGWLPTKLAWMRRL